MTVFRRRRTPPPVQRGPAQLAAVAASLAYGPRFLLTPVSSRGLDPVVFGPRMVRVADVDYPHREETPC